MYNKRRSTNTHQRIKPHYFKNRIKDLSPEAGSSFGDPLRGPFEYLSIFYPDFFPYGKNFYPPEVDPLKGPL